MNPISQNEVDFILKQLEILVSSLKKKADLLSFYTAIAFIDKLAQSKRPPLDLHTVEKLIVLLGELYVIKHISFPDVGFSYRSFRDVVDVIHSEINIITTYYNFLRPQVVKLRRSLNEPLRLGLKENGIDYEVSTANSSSSKGFLLTCEFWTKQFDSSILAFRENKSLDCLDAVMASLPLWFGFSTLNSSSQIIKLINKYLDLSDDFIVLIRELVSSNLEQLPTIDIASLEQQVQARDQEKIKLLKQSISEINIAKDLPKPEKAKLKQQKDQLNAELSSVLEKQKKEIEGKVSENKKRKEKLIAIEKRAKSYRQTVTSRLEREVIKALNYLVSTYDLTRTKDPVWADAKRQMRKILKEF
ncbi:MAG: hypothetical protein WAQ98_20345 [Blastocatellia bacterium]